MNKSRKTIFRRLFTHLIGLSMCSVSLGYAVVPQIAPAAEDAYLDALEAEAERSAKIPKKPPARSSSQAKGKSSETKLNKANAEFQIRFEQVLENERPATYRFYTKLPDQAKTSVVEIYKQSNKISTASKKVFDLYFNQMKK